MRTRNYESPVATLPATASAREIARQLDDRSVGSIVVVDESQQPLGIVTDRDLLVRVVAEGRDPHDLRAAELMTKPLVQAEAHEPIERLIERMAAVRGSASSNMNSEGINGCGRIRSK